MPRSNHVIDFERECFETGQHGQELGGEALRGTLEQNEAGRWTLSYVELESWLSRYAGRSLCWP